MYPLETRSIPVVDIITLTREEWLEVRKNIIGGSGCGTVFALTPFKTSQDSYYDKISVTPAVPVNSNWVQKNMEHYWNIWPLRVFPYKTGYELMKIPIMYRHPEYDFMFINVDYFYRKPDGP